MAVISSRLSRAFISSVRLPAPPRLRAIEDSPPVKLKETEAQTLVVGSGLIVAAENVPVQTREDLINCTLFAQLAATAAVGDQTKISEWYNAYFKTLTAIGWAQSDVQFEEYEFKSQNAEAHKAIIKVLEVLLGPGAAALVIVKTAMEALQSMNENSPWITLFDRTSKTGKSARFQVATAEVGTDDLLQAALVGFDLRATSTLTQVLFFKFSKGSTKLKYAAGKATIYEAALKDQRATITARLAAYRAAYVGDVALPPPPGARQRSVGTPKKPTRRKLAKPKNTARALLR
jgi:hypothetical protein